MTDPVSSDERSHFETWADQQGYDIERFPAPFTNSADRNGPYRAPMTAARWQAWEARAIVETAAPACTVRFCYECGSDVRHAVKATGEHHDRA